MSTKNTKLKKVGDKRGPKVELTKESAIAAEDLGAKTKTCNQDGDGQAEATETGPGADQKDKKKRLAKLEEKRFELRESGSGTQTLK